MKENLRIKEDLEFALKNHQKNNFEVAEKFYKKILEVDPDHFKSIFLLGTLSAQTKNFNQAKQLLQKAIEINPNHNEAHNNLGNVLMELKEFEKAKNCYEKAIQIYPNYTDAHNNLGIVFHKLKESEKAINCYKKVIQIQPNNVNVYNNLGVVLKELGKYQEAINCYKKAIQIQPNNADAYYNLGVVFRALDDFKNSINFYKKAIQIRPNFPNSHINLAYVFEQLGDFQKAINSYEEAIKYKPENLNIYFSLSFLKKGIMDKNLRNKIENIIKNDYATKKNMVYGNYLLAKYEREKKNYEEEFNYLIRGHLHYFELEKEKFLRKIKHWFDVLPNINKLINLNKSNGNINNNYYQIKPIFIIGVPRCGSTLIEKVIASGINHIPIGEETGILDKFIIQKIKKKQLLNLNRENFKIELFNEYKHKGLLQKKSDYIFTDKSLENFFYIELIKEIFPNAKVINCKRNALSSIVSIFQTNLIFQEWAHNLEHIFKYFDIYYRIIKNFKNNFPNFIYELEYEKFVNEPEIESKKLMSFCNLPWDKKCLEFYKRKDIVCKTTSNIQIRDPIYKNSLDKYAPYKKLLGKYGNKYSWFN